MGSGAAAPSPTVSSGSSVQPRTAARRPPRSSTQCPESHHPLAALWALVLQGVCVCERGGVSLVGRGAGNPVARRLLYGGLSQKPNIHPLL